ncbi:MAG: MATE family efflux transporter, partial [Spirillospora sp.]
IVVGWPLVPGVVDAFGASPAVVPYAETYLRVSLLGIPSMLLVLAGTGVLRGLQDTRTPLVVSIGGFSMNLLLNVLFVIVLDWGIAGSAWGTVLAQTASAAVYVAVVLRAARRHGASVRPDMNGLRTSATAGVGLLVRTAALRVVLIAGTSIAARMGDEEIAAYQVGFQVWMLLAFALDAIAIAGQAITGRYLGASDLTGTRAVTRRMVGWGIVCGVVFGLVILAVRPWLPGLFTSDGGVRDLLLASLLVVAVLQPVAGVVFVLDGILIGAGDGAYLAVTTLVATVVFLPAAIVVYRTDAGLTGLWLAIGLWMLTRMLTLALRARGDRWMVTGAVR